METIDQIRQICDGIPYIRDVPEEAKKLAEENNIVIIVGGSDDLMYCYGSESYLSGYCEHCEGWDGSDLTQHASDLQLKEEAKQLGLKIFWCGKIERTGEILEDYDLNESGAFSYRVNENIDHRHFKVMECEGDEDVYCTGIIIKLPNGFKSYSKK
jgi:hypothetical protein